MEAPKFSFVVETQETREHKDQRGSITSIIRSHLAYRQHSKRKSKSGHQLRRSSPIKCSVSRTKSCSEHNVDTPTPRSPRIIDADKKEESNRSIKLDTASLPIVDAESEGLSPFAMEYYLDEDDLLKSFYQSDLDARFFPEAQTEPSPIQILSCHSETGSLSAAVGSPGPYTPRTFTDLPDIMTRGSTDTSSSSARLSREDFGMTTQMDMACSMQDYTTITNAQPLLFDGWAHPASISKQTQELIPSLLQQPQYQYRGQLSARYNGDSIQPPYSHPINNIN